MTWLVTALALTGCASSGVGAPEGMDTSLLPMLAALEAPRAATADAADAPPAPGPSSAEALVTVPPRAGLRRDEGPEPFADDQDHVLVAPYIWIPTINTRVQSYPSVTLHPSDVIDNLDFGYMAYLEVRHNRWGVFFDSLSMELADRKKIRNTGDSASIHIEETMLQLGGYYRLGDEQTSLDLMPSVRYFRVKAAPRLNGTDIVSASEGWFEAVVGARLLHALGDDVQLAIRSDVGGFGLGEAADLTYQAAVLFDWRVSERTTLGLGYRSMTIDYDTDVRQTIQGPFFGFGMTL